MNRSFSKYLPERLLTKLNSSPVYSRVAGGAFWSLAGSAFAQGLTILSSIPVARLLGGESYGGLGIVQSTVGAFIIFVGPALGVAATKHIAELRDTNPERAGRIAGATFTAGITISALMAVFLGLTAPFLASSTLNAPELTLTLRLAAFALFFNGLVEVQNGVLSGLEAFRAMAQVNLWRGLIAFPAMILGALVWHLQGVVVALGLISLVTAYANQCAIRQENTKKGITTRYFSIGDEWKILYQFSLPALLSSVVVLAATWSANVLMVNQPSGYMEMGIFNAANQWRIAVLFLPAVLAKPLLPVLSESLNRSRDDYKQVLKLNIVATTVVTAILSIIVGVTSPWIMSFYGNDFTDSWMVLVLLVISGLFSSIAGGLGNALWSMGKMWLNLVLNTVWAIAFIGCFLILLRWGALGLSGAYLISYLLHFVVVGLYLISWIRSSSIGRVNNAHT